MDILSNPSVAVLFGLLFVLAGPIKAMPTFEAIAARMPQRDKRMLALKGAALGALAIVLAVFMAKAMSARYAVSGPAIGTATGLLLTLVGLLSLLGKEQKAEMGAAPSAMSLAFPILLPPYAFGLILLFAFFLPENTWELALLGVILMTLNGVAMVFANAVLKVIGMAPLMLLGSIFGILQVALGVEMMFWGIPAGIASQ